MSSISGSTLLDPVVLNDENATERKCEWTNCDIEATHWLICPACGAKELQCTVHSNMIRNAKVDDTVIFNCTCNHTVLQLRCGIEPL